MKISTKGRYALRIMLDLAMNDRGDSIPLKDICQRQSITVKYMEQIMPMLTKAGYVKSYRGNNGGYRLTRQPAQYRVGDILRVTEGSLAPVACLETDTNPCERQDTCLTLSFWKGLQDVINDYVDHVTLEDLMKKDYYAEGI